MQYHEPNVGKHVEEYSYHVLFSFYLRNEYHLKSPPYIGTYLAKLQEPGVLEVINSDRQVMELFNILVNEALINLSGNNNYHDPFSQ